MKQKMEGGKVRHGMEQKERVLGRSKRMAWGKNGVRMVAMEARMEARMDVRMEQAWDEARMEWSRREC